MALGVQPRLKSRHVVWDPCAVKGAERIGQAHFQGLYPTGAAAALRERRAAEERTGGVAAVGAVETVDGSLCGVRMENVANGAWDVERGGRGRGGVDEGGASACKDVVGGHQTNTEVGDRDREERAWRGSCPDGKRNKHASGPTAVAEGGGGAMPYLEASLNRCGSPDRST